MGTITPKLGLVDMWMMFEQLCFQLHLCSGIQEFCIFDVDWWQDADNHHRKYGLGFVGVLLAAPLFD